MEETKKTRGRPKKVENLNLQPHSPTTFQSTVQHESVAFGAVTMPPAPSPFGYAQVTQATPGPQPLGRTFHTQKQFMHDLFKLKVAVMLRNESVFENDAPNLIRLEHCHVFHTITSDGKKQTRSSSIGGHFHKMEIVEQQGEGLPPKVRCISGPMKEVVKLVHGKRVKVEVPANDFDDHTHEIEYDRSNVIVERTRNVEAAKAEAQINARFQSQNSYGIGTNDD